MTRGKVKDQNPDAGPDRRQPPASTRSSSISTVTALRSATALKIDPAADRPQRRRTRPHPLPAALHQDADQLRTEAQMKGYTGDQCSNCNSMRMKVSGHCMVCEDCGTTTGCS